MNLREFAADPLAFMDALVIPSTRGAMPFKDCMAPFQRERFAAIAPALVAVANGTKPECGRYWWEATKGASKDSDLACCVLWLLAFAKQPQTVQIGAADRDQASEMQKAMKDVLRLNDWLAKRIKVLQWKVVCEATNSECEILAADTAGSHGARPSFLCLNELSHVTKREYAENLIDNTAKVPHGLVVIATNAGMQGSWQHQWRKIAEDSSEWSMHVYDKPSPWLSEAHVAEASRRNSKTRWLRLFFGVWGSPGGDAVEPEILESAFRSELRPHTEAMPDWTYCAGVDLGISRDASAVCTLAVRRQHAGHGVIRLASTRIWLPTRGSKVDLQSVENYLADLDARFDLKQVCYDPYEARHLASRLQAGGMGKISIAPGYARPRKEGLPMVEVSQSGKNLVTIASTVIEAFNDRRVELYEDADLRRDLFAMRIVEKSYGHRLEFPKDEHGHGDLGTAFGLAMLAASELASRRRPQVWVGCGGMDTQPGESTLQRAIREMDAEREAERRHQEHLDRKYGT